MESVDSSADNSYGSIEETVVDQSSHRSLAIRASGVALVSLWGLWGLWILISSAAFPEVAASWQRENLNAATTGGAAEVSISNWYTEAHGPIGRAYPWLGNATIVDAGMPCWVRVSRRGQDKGPGEELVVARHVATGKTTEAWTSGSVAQLELVVQGKYEVRAAGRVLQVHALRVRHEVRELNAVDRDRLLDTMQTLWRVDGPTGRRLYGPEFVSAAEFQIWHHLNAAQRDADHFHQGFGFFTQHARITLQFEAALRAVEPKVVACPYWDFTIDGQLVAVGEQSHIFDSVLFTSTWWGSVRMSNFSKWHKLPDATSLDEFRIRDGRFANLVATTVPDGSSVSGLRINARNAYAQVRAPWNNNPSRFVTRFVDENVRIRGAEALPHCASHLGAVTVPSPLAPWLWNVQNGPHASMHAMLGGTISTQRYSEAFASLFRRATGQSEEDIVVHTLYRLGVVDFPSTCGDYRTCVPTCNTTMWSLEDIGRQVVLSLRVNVRDESREGPLDESFWFRWDLYQRKVYETLERYLEIVDNTSPKILRQLGSLYCARPQATIEGDQKDSSGSLDPVFWTLHPTMERLYLLRILSGVGFTDYDWPHERACGGARADVSVHDLEGFVFAKPLPTLQAGGIGLGEVCAGHYADSIMFCNAPRRHVVGDSDDEFSDDLDGKNLSAAAVFCVDKKNPVGEKLDLMRADNRLGRSNAQILALMDPRKPPAESNFEYPVYHHFRMRHCDKLGLRFPNVDG